MAQLQPTTLPSGREDYETDPENLKPIVICDLSAVSDAWSIEPAAAVDKGKPQPA